MIQKLKIQNFQVHKNLELDFKSGVNLILGDSNVGKTSIVRALELLRTGNPKNPIYSSGSPVIVEMTLNGKTYSVTKTIKKDKVTKTIWKISDQEYDGSNFKPDIGLRDINIQKQFEPFYMLSKTPGQIGKEIQFVTGIDLADEIKSKLNSNINTLKGDINKLENDIGADKKELGEFPDLKKIKKQIYLYERNNEKRKKEEDRLENIVKLSKQYLQLKDRICISGKKIAYFEKSIKIQEEKGQADIIIELISKAIELKGEIGETNKKINHLEIEKHEIEQHEIESIKIQEEKETNYDIIKLISTSIKLERNIKESKFKVDKLKNQYKKELGDFCPTCGNEIDEIKLKRIL